MKLNKPLAMPLPSSANVGSELIPHDSTSITLKPIKTGFFAMALVAVSLFYAAQVAVAQPVEGQYYRIKNVRSQKVLALAGATAGVDSAQILQREPGPYEGQHWKFVKVGRFYKIIYRQTGLALNVQNAAMEAGTPIIQWDASDPGRNQQWSIEDKGGSYMLKARHSGLVLDVASGSTKRKAPLIQYPAQDSNNENQLFELVPVKK